MNRKKENQKIEMFRYSGLFLLLLMSLTLFLTSSLFYFHISLTKFHFWGSLLLSGFLFYGIFKKEKKKLLFFGKV